MVRLTMFDEKSEWWIRGILRLSRRSSVQDQESVSGRRHLARTGFVRLSWTGEDCSQDGLVGVDVW